MRSVFYGVLLTVFFAGAGYVQAANDQDYISISDEPAFKPKSTVYSDKKKKTKSSTGDDYISISDEPAFTPKPSTGDDDYISISDESVITPKPSTGIADGNASAGECGKGKQLCRDGFCRVSCETSDGLGTSTNGIQIVEDGRGDVIDRRAGTITLDGESMTRGDGVNETVGSDPVISHQDEYITTNLSTPNLPKETGGSKSFDDLGPIDTELTEGQPPRQ